MVQPHASHFVNGHYREDTAGEPMPVIYGATGEEIARVHSATPAVIDEAVASARAAQAAWAALRPVERGRILTRAAQLVRARNDEIARIESLDTGRAIQETSVVDALSVAEALEFYGGVIASFNGEQIDFGASFAYTRREPHGVCLGIGAWNYPFQGAGWKSAPALAAGNAMIFKPSENAPLSALLLAEAYREAGLPDGLFNVVQGNRSVGQTLVTHPAIAKVSLTGSVETGRKVASLAGAGMKAATMELGGKSPLIIFEDAPLDNAVSGALLANFYSTGQVCTNGTRVFVQRSIMEAFLEKAVRRTRNILIGDPLLPETQMGPLISAAQQAKVLGYIRKGIDEGATLLCGGKVPTVAGFPGGNWIEPTIFADVRDEMTIAREEIFGPVMSVFAFDSEDEVLVRANASDLGLAAGVFTTDITRAHRCARRLQAGVVWINTYNLAPVEMPFGGVRQSGLGRECAMAALEHYTAIKSVYVEGGPVESPF